ncbi:MAG: trigger factor [Planctomycetaceae bacterium]|jgi:trigger factor|nr:trigger factor [Planctomycetaceae bacterium]MBT4726520.1 trigger factor [Planctomycetaceae bacterium]MBT5124710.1 trigger factor [Planctomycetaceae bacterium]MBT5597539.1 trigger factor [Planctomycetaceae bacterium]MBT5885907.1 trigger factor [Planctomycetaceae bacterium]
MSEQDTNETNDINEEVLDTETDTVENDADEAANNIDTDTDNDSDVDERLNVDVQVNTTGACERHIVVTVSKEDIARYKDDAYNDLMPKAQIPGFRIGRAPRKLVETRFKSDVADQIKGSLIMDAMSQVTDEQDFSAISEPDFNFDAVQMPDDSELTFEFTVEVRPEFDMPQWKGLKLETVVHDYTEDEVSTRAQELLQRYGNEEDIDGEIATGDIVNVTIEFKDGNEIVTTLEDTRVPVRSKITFSDGDLNDFDKLVVGAHVGDNKETTASLSADLDNDELAGKEYTANIKINEAKRVTVPELTPEFLEEIGGFSSETELHDAVRDELERQLNYHQQQRVRRQITEQLTAEAAWELPPQLLRRQAQRELQRSILELQAAGFPDEEIRRQINQLQQNMLGTTERSLKEHFILERIAEDHDLDASPEDIEKEILIISLQQETSPRRVRAQLEKRGDMDALRNQIVERKAIDLITSEADMQETELPEDPATNTSPVSHAISGIKPSSAAATETKDDDTANETEEAVAPTDETQTIVEEASAETDSDDADATSDDADE